MALYDELDADVCTPMKDAPVRKSFTIQINAALSLAVFLVRQSISIALWPVVALFKAYIAAFWASIYVVTEVFRQLWLFLLLLPPFRLCASLLRGYFLVVAKMADVYGSCEDRWHNAPLGDVLYHTYFSVRRRMWESIYRFVWFTRLLDVVLVLGTIVVVYNQSVGFVPTELAGLYFMQVILSTAVLRPKHCNALRLMDLLGRLVVWFLNTLIYVVYKTAFLVRKLWALKERYWLIGLYRFHITFWYWFGKAQYIPDAAKGEWNSAVPAIKKRPAMLVKEFPNAFVGLWDFLDSSARFKVGVSIAIHVSTVLFSMCVMYYAATMADMLQSVTVETYVLTFFAVILWFGLTGLEKLALDMVKKVYDAVCIDYEPERLMLKHRWANPGEKTDSAAPEESSIQTQMQQGSASIKVLLDFVTTQPTIFIKAAILFAWFLYVYPLLMVISAVLMMLDVYYALYRDVKIKPLNTRRIKLRNKFYGEVERNLDNPEPSAKRRILRRYKLYRLASISYDVMRVILGEVGQAMSLGTVFGGKLFLLAPLAFADMTYGQYLFTVGMVLSTQGISGVFMYAMQLMYEHCPELRVVGRSFSIPRWQALQAN